MTQINLRVSTPVAGLFFLQNHPRTATQHLMLMAQGVVDMLLYQPFTVCVGGFEDNSLYLFKQGVLGIP